MEIGKISSFLIKSLSGLANNNDSIAPMAAKDLIADAAIIDTYAKEGTVEDAIEKGIEEVGTSCLWLFGIPLTKKVIDKTIYPAFGINPDLDLRVIDNKDKFEAIKNTIGADESALKNQKEIFESLGEKCKFLGKHELPFTNKQMYKGLFYGKFAVATALCAFALTKLITYKQNMTEKRLEKDYYKNNASKILLNQSIKGSESYRAFTGKNNEKGKDVAFKGLGAANLLKGFIYNPIKNTMILDGTIAATRLSKARKGERFEVAFREGFSFLFIYCIAKPIQKAFEALGRKLNLPIEADPNVIFTNGLKDKIAESKEDIQNLLKSDNAALDIFKLNPKGSLTELLEKSGTIKTLKDKNGATTAISRFKEMSSDDIKTTLKNILALDKVKDLSKVKIFKTVAVLGNVAIAILAMGKLQPKLNILFRKLRNQGDNRNPAIVAKQREIEAKHNQN